MCNLIAKVPRSNSYTKHGHDDGSEVSALLRTSQDFPLESVCRTTYWEKKKKKREREKEKSRILSARLLNTVITVLCEVKKEHPEWMPRPSVT